MIASLLKVRLIAIAFGVACAHAAFAQTPPNPSAPSANGATPMGRPMGGPHGGHMMRELGRLKTSLKLDAAQTQLWDRAEASMKSQGDMRDQMRARHERMGVLLDDPNFDPKRLAADMDSAQAERDTRMKSTRDAWIAVYQSLNPVQRGQAREFLRSHLRGPRMHGPMGEGHRRGSEPDGPTR